MAVKQILVGRKFGRLTVIKEVYIKAEKGKRQAVRWECLCDCGNTVISAAAVLLCGHVKSCGCLKKEKVKENFDKYRETRKLPHGEAHKKNIYNRYKREALRKKYAFEITIEEFTEITQRNCHYCDATPTPFATGNNQRRNGLYVGNGIDRMDNNIGYIYENCVPCCTECNYAKRKRSYNEFISWIHKAHNHLVEVEESRGLL